MHGLILTAFQTFFCKTYGRQRWAFVMEAAGSKGTEFEAMLTYDDKFAYRVIDKAATTLERLQSDLLEDLGTFLVSDPGMNGVRRLLRFSGVDYLDFLHSLEELPERTRLAVPDLVLPALDFEEHTSGLYRLVCYPGLPGYSAVLMGVLRAMADDYGALVMLEHVGEKNKCDILSIAVIETTFAEGKSFELRASE